MFGSSAALKNLQLENAQLRMELKALTELVQSINDRVLSEMEINSFIEDAVNDRMSGIDIAAEVESAVENCLDRATISVRF
jgi:hypothetical protein